MREEFVFQFGHVHVGRTLGLAAFAFEAQIERFIEFFAGEFLWRHLPGQDLTHEIRASSRGVLVLECHHVRRTHRALVFLAADTRAVTKLHRGSESAFARKIVMRVQGQRFVLRPIAQVLGHWRRVDDFSRIHPMIWIERCFDLAECVIELWTKQFLVQMAACQAVTVLAAHPAAECDHEIGDLVRHLFHDLNFACILRVDERPDV